MRAVLVVTEIAMACVLLVASGLLVRSFVHVLDVQLGFRPEQASTLRVDPPKRFNNIATARNKRASCSKMRSRSTAPLAIWLPKRKCAKP